MRIFYKYLMYNIVMHLGFNEIINIKQDFVFRTRVAQFRILGIAKRNVTNLSDWISSQVYRLCSDDELKIRKPI